MRLMRTEKIKRNFPITILSLNFHIKIMMIFTLFIYGCSNRNAGEKPKIKIEKSTTYYYEMGIPKKEGSEPDSTFYNENGLATMAVTSSSKTLYIYEHDSLLTSITKYGKDGKIWYKKNINYDNMGHKLSFKIYSSSTTTDAPELISGMNFYYDADYNICEKRYFGAIDYTEEEGIEIISDSPDEPDMFERERARQADSTSAKYIRNKEGKIAVVYFDNDRNSRINYTYNGENKLVSRINHSYNRTNRNSIYALADSILDPTGKPISNKYYEYLNNKKIRIREVSNNGFIEEQIFDEKERLVERKGSFKNGNLVWTMKYSYFENGLLKEMIKYNSINEPEFADRYEYTVY